MTKRYVEGCPDRIIGDCNCRPLEGWYYTVGDKWAYVWRGGTKKYRIRRSYNVDIVLWSITKRNTGYDRSVMVMTFIKEHGEEI